MKEGLYLQGQLLWAWVPSACWTVSHHLALVGNQRWHKADPTAWGFLPWEKGSRTPSPLRGHWLQCWDGSSSLLGSCSASWDQEEDVRRVAGGNSGLSSPSQSPPRWSLLSFLPQPVVTSLSHFARCFWCEHLLPAAAWYYHLLLVLRKNLWYQNISLALYDPWPLGMRLPLGVPWAEGHHCSQGGRGTTLCPITWPLPLERTPPPAGVSLLCCALLNGLPAPFTAGLQDSGLSSAASPLHILRGRHFVQAVRQFWGYILSPSLFSQHPFRNWTADLATACCITAFGSGNAGTESPPLLLPVYCSAPHSIPLAVFAMLLYWESSPAVCFTIIGFITSLTKPQSNLKLC